LQLTKPLTRVFPQVSFEPQFGRRTTRGPDRPSGVVTGGSWLVVGWSAIASDVVDDAAPAAIARYVAPPWQSSTSRSAGVGQVVIAHVRTDAIASWQHRLAWRDYAWRSGDL
jgi:hypothetical protein